METVPWPFYIGILAAIIGNILWYWIKAINRSNGYKAHLFIHSGDFKELILKEKNLETKKKYERVLKSTYAALGVLIIAFIATVLLVFLKNKIELQPGSRGS